MTATGAARPLVRDAVRDDAAACADVYRPYVTGSAATFEVDPPDAADFAGRIAAAQRRHAWLVAEQDGAVVGYAYGGPFRARPAYDWTCETTVYLAEEARGAGTGRLLMTALLDRLRERGQRRAVAVIAVPNDASVGLHASLGYRRVAHLERIGWKRGAWRDVDWLQLDLVAGDDPPGPLA